ncbi:hypothetical protein DJ58_4278 [Yersinia frederiksenii ATCC 33641]|uniref:Uncharacterized protein n=1 Tax=Yersinia frederiksenii ATCC 33641 TaxID=349966 RepID=A0ABR4VWV2_YERFR|nr:hypothetical protein DJ58_4278 [Yersinia frederiksenii ATCC 33641]
MFHGDPIQGGAKVFGVVDPVGLDKRLEYSVFALILFGIAIHKGFYPQTGLDIAIAFARDICAIGFFMLISFDTHPGDLGFRLDKIRGVFRGILTDFKSIATFHRGGDPFRFVLFSRQTLTIDSVIEPAVLRPAVHIQAGFIGAIGIPGAIDAGAVAVHRGAGAVA